MNWIKRLFSKKEIKKQEINKVTIKKYVDYNSITSRKDVYEPNPYQSSRNSDNDLLNPLNLLNPIWHDDNYSHNSGCDSSYDYGTSSSDYSSSSSDSSSYDSGSSLYD